MPQKLQRDTIPSQPGESSLDTARPSTAAPPSDPRPSQPGEDALGKELEGPTDTQALIDQARFFLRSSETAAHDAERKRIFLLEKGVHAKDIDVLLAESTSPPPPLPPRTYPGARTQGRSHTLLNIMTATKFVVTAASSSAALILVYWWLILPRISNMFAARAELGKQRIFHSQKLVDGLKETSSTIVSASHRLPEAGSDEMANGEASRADVGISHRLAALASTLSKLREARAKRNLPDALQSVTNLTGYISSQIYLPSEFTPSGRPKRSVLGPMEDEVRAEIRALKGLALNRRSFLPAQSLPGAVGT